MNSRTTILTIFLIGPLSACAGRGDALAPVVTITEPQGGAVRAGTELRIVGYAMDDVGVASIKADGAELLDYPALAGERGKKLINFGFRPQQVREGLWRSQLTVTDVDGRTTGLTLPLTIDGAPPTVDITGVEGLADGRRRVSGVARDDDLVKSVMIGENMLSLSPAVQVSFTFPTDGTLSVTVTDQAGNVTTLTP